MLPYELADFNDYLEHHGIKGQKWGIRRYQNEDGSLTSEGQERYCKAYARDERKRERLQRTVEKRHGKTEKAQRKADRIRPGLVMRLLLGKEGRQKVSTLRSTMDYKVSKARDSERRAARSLNRLEKRMKRKYRDIPLEELTGEDVGWLRG